MAILLIVAVMASTAFASCANKEFMSCVVQLSSQKIPFDTNLMHVLNNITTEAKLMHTCRAYERVFPCFQQRLTTCGSKSQKGILERGKRLHSYLCAPFSLQRQKIFFKVGECIRKTTTEVISSKCFMPSDGTIAKKLESCRLRCGENPICNTKTDQSEIAACTFLRLEKHCGIEAAQFFAQMQQVITGKEYPVQCSYDPSPSQTNVPTSTNNKRTDNRQRNVDYSSSSYITVYPKDTQNKTTVRRLPERKSNVGEDTYFKIFGPSNSAQKTSLNGKVNVPSFLTTTPPPVVNSALPLSNSRSTYFAGARPIPDSVLPYLTVVSPRLESTTTNKASRTTLAENSTRTVHPPGNGFRRIIGERMLVKMSQTSPSSTSLHPTLLPTMPQRSNEIGASTDVPNYRFIFAQEPTPKPFKISINWMDDPNTETPWYQRTFPQLLEETTTTSNPFSVVEPIFNKLKSQPLNFTEMGNKASNYFSAALNAFSSDAHGDQPMRNSDNDPWRSIIDAVAPTIHAVSPEIIPRIRQEMERLESN